MADGLVDTLGHFVHGQVRDGAVQRRGADKRVNARLAGGPDRLPAAVDVGQLRAGQPADHRVFRVPGNFRHGGKVAFGGDGKACLDDVDTHFVQKAGDFQLFGVGHGGAGRLFTVTQGRVKNDNAVLFLGHESSLYCPKSLWRAALPSERARRNGTLRGGLGSVGRAGSHAKRGQKGYVRPVSWEKLIHPCE